MTDRHEIAAPHECPCAKCGGSISKSQQCRWERGVGMFHIDCDNPDEIPKSPGMPDPPKVQDAPEAPKPVRLVEVEAPCTVTCKCGGKTPKGAVCHWHRHLGFLCKECAAP